MNKLARRKHKEFEILDVTAEVIRDYNLPFSLLESDEIEDDGETGGRREDAAKLSSTRARTIDVNSNASVSTPRGGPLPSDSGYYGDPGSSSLVTEDASPAGAATSQRQTESAVANLLYLSQSGQQPPTVDAPLPAHLGAVPMDLITDFIDHQIQAFTPDGAFEDGIFLPGSAYHELHSTLRNHLIQEVRSNAPTRPGTPRLEVDGPQEDAATVDEDLDESLHASDDLPPTGVEPPMLTKDEECILWRNWFDEIAPWLDKFDKAAHFQNIIPTMAPDHDYLRYSILALSARQVELKETTLPTDRSLALYQEAIHLLLPHLPTRSTSVIATCVILCVLEMLSCSPKAWRRHLDGCASLMEAVGINGFVGGTEEALFWCFARMDVCGGLISSVKTLIPIGHWAPGMDVDGDVALFRSRNDFHQWANYSVYLLAQVLDLLAPLPGTTMHVPTRTDPKFRKRWLQLWSYISDWHDHRPAPLHSVMSIPSSDASPFPTILFSNPAGISGNQLYHTAALVMLQNKPPGIRLTPKPRSILWHARQICAISISNNHHGAWTNAAQPLWIAGRCMSHPAEHKAILELLERIERESGWGTKWRADDLKEFWGDLGE